MNGQNSPHLFENILVSESMIKYSNVHILTKSCGLFLINGNSYVRSIYSVDKREKESEKETDTQNQKETEIERAESYCE